MMFVVYVQDAETKKVSPDAWELVNFYPTKGEATEIADGYRRRGYRVRIVKQ